MKKAIAYLFFGTFLGSSIACGSQQTDEKTDTGKNTAVTSISLSQEKKEETPENQSSIFISLYNRGANLYYNVTASSDVEQSKFPTLNVSKLGALLKGCEEDLVKLMATPFPYETGSREGSSDYYKGSAWIEALDYGEAFHRYLGPTLGFSPTVDHTTSVESVKFADFLKKWLGNHEDKDFYKATPYKGIDSKTRLDYILYNARATQYIKFTLKREKREQ